MNFSSRSRRYAQHIADIVKAVPHVIRWKRLVHIEVDPQQVAYGVVIFSAIQSSQSDTARVRIFQIARKCGLF